MRAYADIAQNLTEAGYSDAEAAALQKEVEFYSDTRAAIKKHSGEELDIKPYEADMRHLLNTYVQADPAADLGNLSALSLTELIIETGIHDAIARKLNEKGKLSKNAIAEGIINNVRKTIIRDQLTDPRFYDGDVEAARRPHQAKPGGRRRLRGSSCKKAEELVKRLAKKQPDGRRAGGAARQAGSHRALQQPGQHPGDDAFSARRMTTRRRAACARTRPRHARAGSGGLEGRRDAREAGAQCAVSRSWLGTAQATQAIFEIIKNQPGY